MCSCVISNQQPAKSLGYISYFVCACSLFQLFIQTRYATMEDEIVITYF